MASRIDIELTSRRDDDTWTWRAAGARQPKGVVDASLVPPDGVVGLQLRAEVEVGVDGITVTSVLPLKTTASPTAAPRVQRIEVIGSGRPTDGVSVTFASSRRPPSGERRDAPGRPGAAPGRARRAGPERDGETRQPSPRRPGGPRQPASAAPTGASEASPGHRRGPDPGNAGGHRAPTGERRPAGGERGPARIERGPAGIERGPAGIERRGSAPARRNGSVPGYSSGSERGRRHVAQSTKYRNEALAELRPEQLPVAEQLLRGGIPRVRQAIEEQNARARSEGRGEVAPEPLLAMAEALLPKVNVAIWMDRAVTARDAGRETPLRELRSIITSATTVTLDDEGRALAATLRQSLQERVTAMRDAWLARITKALDDGRVLDALSISSKPPEHAARLPAELAVRLAEQAGAAMVADLFPDQWLALLRAVVDSPVRRTVRPAALPKDADDQLRSAAHRAAGLVPELARLLGLRIPPPPGPRRPAPVARRI
ncbi:MAG: hypothetical protein M0Z82_05580 [Actinomycetota bacterium]|nr:hypothetical protein [Actinomycetota bacterium]